jgi:hypothetical protein
MVYLIAVVQASLPTERLTFGVLDAILILHGCSSEASIFHVSYK